MDFEKLCEALRFCSGEKYGGCNACPRRDDERGCEMKLMSDAAFVIESLLKKGRMLQMTVEELFDHLNFNPDSITFFDPKDNVEDTVWESDDKNYNLFLIEYGFRIVKKWRYLYTDKLEIKLG